jgi:hypothetical protein
MAKRTRYPKRTPSRATAKRPLRPAGTGIAPAPAAPPPAPELDDIETSLETFDDMPVRSVSGLTEAEVRRAEQLEAEATAREREAIAASLRRQVAARNQEVGAIPRADINAPLSVRMSHEYAYVARDVRRILLTAGLMVAILAVLAILINVLGVISI